MDQKSVVKLTMKIFLFVDPFKYTSVQVSETNVKAFFSLCRQSYLDNALIL